MISRILFTYVISSNLDADCKTWRFAADIFNDIGYIIEIFTPIFVEMTPFTFGLISCAANVSKCLCGVAGISTRSVLSEHFAKSKNMADLSAKDASQETIVGLTGMLVGTLLAAGLGEDEYVETALIVSILIVVHLYANYLAVSNVVLNTLNRQRFWLVARRYFEDERILTPKEVSGLEKIFWSDCIPLIHCGNSLSQFISRYGSCESLLWSFLKSHCTLSQ